MKLLLGLIIGGTILGLTFGYYFSRGHIQSLSQQIDLKTSKANISWIYGSSNTCDTSKGSCRNYSSSSSSSSWGGSSSSGGK